MVRAAGIEPATPSMSPKCSPAELHARVEKSVEILIFRFREPANKLTVLSEPM